MAALAIVIVKISCHAALDVGQVAENGPLARPQPLGFQPRPEALRPRVVGALVPATLRAQTWVLVEQGAVSVGALLPPAVRANEPAGGRLTGQQGLA